MKCLFIGGHAAGRIIDVDIRRDRIVLPDLPKTPATLFSEEIPYPVNAVFRETTYKWDCLTGKEGARTSVYVAEGVDALGALMDFYANSQHPQA